MNNIVYSKPGCGFSRAAVTLLREHRVDFEEKLVDDREERERLKEEFECRTFPIVVLNGKYVGGYDDTRALVDGGRLQEILCL